MPLQKFSQKIQELRKKAEDLLLYSPRENRDISEADINSILHELDVYQIELQLQNEELLLAQNETKVNLIKYQDLYDFSPIGIFNTDSRGIILDINLTACNYLGKGRAFLKNKPLTAYLAGESHKAYFDHIESALSSGLKQTCEIKVFNLTGLNLIFQMESIPFTENGNYFIRSAIIDITEKKKALVTINERESLLRSLLDSSQNAVIIFEIKGFQSMGQPMLKLWDANPKASLLFPFGVIQKGMTPEELFQGNYRYMDSFIEDIYSVASTGENIVRDVRFPLPKKFSNFKVNLVKFLHGISLTFTDITKETESSREKDIILSTIVENLPEQDVHIFNSEKKIVRSGGTLSLKLGYPIDAWTGNRPSQLFSDEIGDILEKLFDEALLGKAAENEFSLFGIPIYANAIPIYNDEKEIILGLCLLRNISQERKKTQELENEKINLEIRIKERAKDLVKLNQEYREELEKKKQLEKELILSRQWESIGNLAAGIAHDFNNILQPINTYTTLSEGLLDSDSPEIQKKLKTYLSRIRISSEKGKNIVQQVLDFSKSKEETFDPIDIRLELEEAIRNALSQTQAPITFDKNLPTEPSYVFCYPSGVYQIVFNLLQNAIHAIQGREQPNIKLLFSKKTFSGEREFFGLKIHPGNYYCIDIVDNGFGIPESKHKTIFEAFYTDKENLGGTGLGLAIVHGILKRIKGGVELESKIGEGSRFSVFLPIANLEISQEISWSQKSPETISILEKEATKPRVLLVDDDDLILVSLKEALGVLNFSVYECNSGEQAFEFFKKNPDAVDIVITDQKMQGMDGTELIEKIKMIKKEIPAIVCTGFSSLLSKSDPPLGINKVFVKPIDMFELSKEIRSILKQKA